MLYFKKTENSVLDLESIAKKIIASGKMPDAGKREDGEPEGEVIDPKGFDPSYHGSTIILAKDIGDRLSKLYPGWAWTVQPGEFAKTFCIRNMHCHEEWGYIIRFEDIMNDPSRKQAMLAGGEILYRFGMKRTSMEKNFDRLQSAPRDMKGRLIPFIDDIGNKKEIQSADIARKLATGKANMEIDSLGNKYLKVDHR